VNFWFLVQLLVNIVLFAGVVGLWVRLHRPHKDDPRLSKGLQLLQSKIAILEDLSDRTEVQVGQLTALLEQKCKEIQSKIQASEKQLSKIDQSTQKSLEVAKIFQDRIPHGEILERQNTVKYVKAARLAHQGLSFDEIAQQVDLSRGEIEFIAKVNKDQLMFCEDSLPEWAQEEPLPESNRDLSAVFEVPKNDQQALKKLGEAFKAACAEAPVMQEAPVVTNVTAPTPTVLQEVQKQQQQAQTLAKGSSVIRPVEFRRLDMTKDLR
jgi:hypothetical protein